MFSLTILMNNLRLAGCPVTIYLGKMVKRAVRNFVSLSVNISSCLVLSVLRLGY